MTGKKCQKRKQLVSWALKEPLSTSLCFVILFVFLLFTTYEFWFVFLVECQPLVHELVMEFGFQLLFYCEDEDDVKRLVMRLVVDENKYEKAKKTKQSSI
jgi:hypothetical protein